MIVIIINSYGKFQPTYRYFSKFLIYIHTQYLQMNTNADCLFKFHYVKLCNRLHLSN